MRVGKRYDDISGKRFHVVLRPEPSITEITDYKKDEGWSIEDLKLIRKLINEKIP